MRPIVLPYLLLLVALLASCIDNKSFEVLFIQTLSIAPDSTSYRSESGQTYIESTLISQQDSQIFQLSMEKGIRYMLVTTQPESELNATVITLVNMYGDTLAESIPSVVDKSVIFLKSPETAQYYVIVKLKGVSNPSFVYRLYFESIVENEMNYAGLPWQAFGDWENTSTNSLSIQNNNSLILRSLKLLSTDYPNGNLSFKIKNTGSDRPNFGIVIDGDENYNPNIEMPYTWTKGSIFRTREGAQSFLSSGKIENGYGGHTGRLDDVGIDFLKGVQVDVNYTQNGYSIYLNNHLVENFENLFLNYFYILVEDRGNGKTIIEDFSIEMQ